jgi:hypothetical protein
LNGIKFEKDKTDRIMKCFFPPKVQFWEDQQFSKIPKITF